MDPMEYLCNVLVTDASFPEFLYIPHLVVHLDIDRVVPQELSSSL